MLQKLEQRLQLHQPWRLRQRSSQRAAVLVALTDEEDPRVTLTLRSSQLSTHQGEIAFPGGKEEPEDVDLKQTALREAEEEVGLAPASVRLIGALGDVLSKHRLQVSPWVGIHAPDIELIANPAEIERIYQVPLRFFLEQSPLREDIIPAGRTQMHIPAWEYEGQIVWGLTAYVLVELLNVGFDAGIRTTARPERCESQPD